MSDCGGQAPALRCKWRLPLQTVEPPALVPVGRGPVPRHALGPRAIAGDRPPRYGPRTVFLSVGRGPVPRHAVSVTETAWALWAADGFRADRVLAGDRPPRYGASGGFRCRRRKTHLLSVGRGPVPRHALGPRAIAGDRPPRYGPRTVFLSVGRGPVPRHAANGSTSLLSVGRGPVPRHAGHNGEGHVSLATLSLRVELLHGGNHLLV